MSRVENLDSLSRENALTSLYHNTRQDPQIHQGLVGEAFARDIKGNLITDPVTQSPVGLEFVPIYHYPPEEIRLKSGIWNELFGPDGYITRLHPDHIEKDMGTVELGFALAEYAHQKQIRQTGESYVQHPERATFKYVRKYKPPVWRVAAFLNHDAHEDTFLKLITLKEEDREAKVPYPYPVSLEDIGHLLGKDAENFDKRLTKIRKIQKHDGGQEEMVTDRTETLFNLLKALGRGGTRNKTTPVDITWKIYDVLDNVDTLSGKPETERINAAAGYFQVYPALAKIVGLDAEGNHIADACYEVLDSAAHNDGFVDKLKLGISRHIDPVDAEGLGNYATEKLEVRSGIGFRKFVVEKPGVFEIAGSMKGRRQPEAEDFYLNATIVLDDEVEFDKKILEEPGKHGFYRRALTAMEALIFTKNFQAGPETGNALQEIITGIDYDAPKESKLANITLYYTYRVGAEERKVPVRIKFKRKSDYDIDTTPLTYLESVALTPEDAASGEYTLDERRRLAKVRQERVTERFRNLVNDPSLSKEEKIRSVLLTLPDSIMVTGVKTRKNKKEHIRNPVPANSTILDYALIRTPGSWQGVKQVFVNGKEESDLGKALNQDDEIRLVFDKKDDMCVEADWLDKINIDPERTRKVIAEMLEKRVSQIENPDQREKFKKQIRDRGWKIINTHVGNLEEFGLVYGRPSFPDPEQDPRDFAYDVGLEKVPQEDIQKVSNYLKGYWQNLTTLRVRVSEANVPGKASDVVDTLRNYGINIVNLNSVSRWGDTASLVLKVDKSDPGFKNITQALSAISTSLGYSTQVFQNEDEHQEWLTQFESAID